MSVETELHPSKELHRKALDQISHLLALKANGMICPQAFRVGVETIWNVIGGICDEPEFNELMHEASEEAMWSTEEVQVSVMEKGDNLIIVSRSGTKVRVTSGARKTTLYKTLSLDDQAAAYAKSVVEQMKLKGMKEVSL